MAVFRASNGRKRSFKRSGGSLLRTIVVASATLAILLVCFSMYQYSLMAPPPSAAKAPRLPSPPDRPSAESSDRTGSASGVTVEGAVIGLSQDITISLYAKEGRDAKLELTVSDWSPREGSDHEFLLRRPEIRMQTNDGNDIRVTANEGALEAKRKGGSGLEPLRGSLKGNVVIEFDRRSKEEKARLPEERRSKPEPADILGIQCESLEFDVEFGRLTIPGQFLVSARDVSLDASHLEVRFDERRGRVESLRIERGGRLELIDAQQRLRVAMPGAADSAKPSQTVVEWLRATIESRVASTRESRAKSSASEPAQSAVASRVATSDAPVFHAKEAASPASVARYQGRFEGEIDARQIIGDATQSRLQADVLEILREFSPGEKQTEAAPMPEQGDDAASKGKSEAPPERIELTWSGRLVVDALPASEVPSSEAVRARVTASGSPARVSHPEGDATCETLSYDPDGGEVRLFGSPSAPVVVRAARQGVITGRSVSVQREDDAMIVSIVGPGRLEGDLTVDGLVAGAGATEHKPAEKSGKSLEKSNQIARREIEFAEEVRAKGRVLQKTAIDFTGAISRREFRVLDHVDFVGRTALREGDTTLEADSLAVDLSVVESWGSVRQTIQRLVGTGDVVMMQKADRMTCDTIDVTMGADPAGRPTPRTAVATGHVTAVQGDRTLEASDKLIVDFERVKRSESTESSAQSPDPAMPIETVANRPNALTTAASSENEDTTVVIARRLRAFGDVSVNDPSQSFEVSCDQFDCKINDLQEIEAAEVVGRDDRPASVRLESFGATGRQISLNVLDQWAEIPGRGRMTFESRKDLDGRQVDRPIPIAVTWAEWMKYRGRENRAEFMGEVHATSESTTTFDSERLLVEFEDAAPKPAAPPVVKRTGVLGMVTRAIGRRTGDKNRVGIKGFDKEPRYIEATGNAVAHTAEVDETTGRMTSRARIAGPKLSVHLRAELSKMLIEGPGTLQLEDFRPPSPTASALAETGASDLFSSASESGPSKTLVQWRDRMWYDFAIDQTLFEGAVQMTHLSGEQLEKVFGLAEGATSSGVPGRRTFLECDVLTIDFLDRSAERKPTSQRMGRLSSERLRQFRAFGTVTLQDEVERLSLTANEVIYERPRKILMIHGTTHQKAQIVKQSPGRLPDQLAAERLFYNMATGQIEVVRASVKGGE